MTEQRKKDYLQLPEESEDGTLSVRRNPKWSKKKKILVWGGLALIVVVAIILILVFTLKSDGDKHHDPTPTPPGPTPPSYTANPFYLENMESKLPYNQTFRITNRIDHPQDPNVKYALDPKLPNSTDFNKLADYVEGQVLLNAPGSYRLSFSNNRASNAESQATAGIPASIFSTDATFDLIKPAISLDEAGFSLTDDPIRMSITVDGTAIFDTNGKPLLMYDKFNEISWNFATDKIYGLGEQLRTFELQDQTTYAMWNSPQRQVVNPQSNMNNLYGTHPFYLNLVNNHTWVGVFVANGYAQTGYVNGTQVTHRTVGGNLDLFVWYGETAQSVLQQYHARIGKSFIPPLWALGFHASDASITKLADLETLADDYLKFGVPLDGLWSDLGYMNNTKDFTLNDDFANVNMTLEKWNQAGVHWVPKLIPSLPNNPPEGYKYPQDLKNNKGALMAKGSEDPYVGSGIEGADSIFFDVWSTGGKQVWEAGLDSTFVNVTQFDGLWLDQTEPQDYKMHSGKTQYSQDLPVIPGGRDFSDSIVPVDSHLTLAEEGDMKYNAYDLHTMYGTKMAQLTSDWMDQGIFKSSARRGFLVGRSTFPGFGKFGGHDLGENESSFDFLRLSIAGMLNMNMFGIPLSGAYVCGQDGAATDDLCSRWYQLAAFYPFLHNHNSHSTPQHPWSFETNFTLYAARGAAHQRYAWLQTLYTLYLDVHSNGGALAMPSFFMYPDELADQTEYSFMWGDKLLIIPCVEANKAAMDTFSAFIPTTEVWYNTTDYQMAKVETTGKVDLLASLNYTHVLLRGGSIVAFQNTTDDQFGKTLNATQNLVQRPVELIIAPDATQSASASFALDDGVETGLSTLKEVSLSYENKNLRVQLTAGQSNPSLPWQTASSIQILGAASILEPTTKVCARYLNLTDSGLDYSIQGPNVVIKNSDNSPIPYMELRYLLLVESGDDNPCNSTFTVTQKTQLSNSAEVLNITLAQPSSIPKSVKANPINKLTVVAELYNTTRMDQDNRVVKINITDAEKSRFTVPLSTSDSQLTLAAEEDITNNVMVVEDPFSLSVVDHQDPSSVQLTTAGQTFVYEDRYIELNMLIASSGEYWGTGDRAPQQFFLKPGIYTSYARDIPTPVETGKPPGNNMYGVHPILYTRLMSGKWMGIFINNANAQDWILEESGNEKMPLLARFVSIGGIIDMYVITGSQIEEVVRSYQDIIGKPVLPPLYAFGYNQCRWGYTSQSALENIFNQMNENKFPIDGLWTDIDYMNKYADFTVDPARYQSLKTFITQTLNADGVQFIPILDAAISADDSDANPSYQRGIQADAYIKSGYTNEPLVGEVWPGKAVYVNHLPESSGAQFWQDELQKFYDNLVPFGGLWLDMNEASNFCNGECPLNQGYKTQDPTVMYNLIYTPGMRTLLDKSLSLNAYAKDGTGATYTQYDTHSLFGYLEIKSTHDWMISQQKRPYIISRSTYAGAGRWGSHWLGDNFARWDYMRYSIAQVMYFNTYSIPLVGADICGFLEDTTPELCLRWMQLGAFYPFMRNHNTWNTIAQEPWAFGTAYLLPMREATYLRYSLLRYLYTSYFQVTQNGGTFFRPRFFKWQDDAKLYETPGDNFLVGDALMVTPILTQGATQQSVYFPQAGPWINHANGEILNLMTPQELTYSVGMDTMFVHQIPGSIVPRQNTNGRDPILRTNKLNTARTLLHIAVDVSGRAAGKLQFDDGVALISDTNYLSFELTYESGVLGVTNTSKEGASYEGMDAHMGQLFVYGVEEPSSVTLKFVDSSKADLVLGFSYNTDDMMLFVDQGLTQNDVKFTEVSQIVFV